MQIIKTSGFTSKILYRWSPMIRGEEGFRLLAIYGHSAQIIYDRLGFYLLTVYKTGDGPARNVVLRDRSQNVELLKMKAFEAIETAWQADPIKL